MKTNKFWLGEKRNRIQRNLKWRIIMNSISYPRYFHPDTWHYQDSYYFDSDVAWLENTASDALGNISSPVALILQLTLKQSELGTFYGSAFIHLMKTSNSLFLFCASLYCSPKRFNPFLFKIMQTVKNASLCNQVL